MARISGIDLPRDKRIEVALTYIYGIGATRAKEILAKTGWETFGLSILESMACGNAQVAANSGAAAEHIRKSSAEYPSCLALVLLGSCVE